MCGIVGYVGSKNAPTILVDGLSHLEYRGYDSAGIVFYENNKFNIIKTEGRISNLRDAIPFESPSKVGVGHTRWATHGVPNQVNSHPHKQGKITLVHNGIVENYVSLKKELKNYHFNSETDTEVVCALIDKLYNEHNDMEKVLEIIPTLLKGSYALGIVNDDEPDKIYAIRYKSPLIVGVGNNENFIASDVPAILNRTKKYILLDDFDVVILSDEIKIKRNGNFIEPIVKEFDWEVDQTSLNGFDHYMLKEIYEQPDVVRRTIESFDKNEFPDFTSYEKIEIVACGSAYHAGLIGLHLIENYTNIEVSIHVASEYRYKKHNFNRKTLVIVISQSGETADSLETVRIAKENNIDTLGIVNVYGSSIARDVKYLIYSKAGCEISVATTKAYLSQITIMGLVASKIAKLDKVNSEELAKIIVDVIEKREIYANIANSIYTREHLFFIGRGIDYYLGLEGSLKLKEISYIHSEAYPAGELKHGTISLVTPGTPFIAIVTDESVADKTISNIKEVKARGARVILLIREDLFEPGDYYDEVVLVPKLDNVFQSLVTIIPLQLIAYETAKKRNCDIDKPRNLAKSVTVE